jgi:hypothetical protein
MRNSWDLENKQTNFLNANQESAKIPVKNYVDGLPGDTSIGFSKPQRLNAHLNN